MREKFDRHETEILQLIAQCSCVHVAKIFGILILHSEILARHFPPICEPMYGPGCTVSGRLFLVFGILLKLHCWIFGIARSLVWCNERQIFIIFVIHYLAYCKFPTPVGTEKTYVQRICSRLKSFYCLTCVRTVCIVDLCLPNLVYREGHDMFSRQ